MLCAVCHCVSVSVCSSVCGSGCVGRMRVKITKFISIANLDNPHSLLPPFSSGVQRPLWCPGGTAVQVPDVY